MEKYEEWLAVVKNENGQLYEELVSIAESEDEIRDRFYCDLTFGTGGLRGKLGAGTNRVNVFVVARASRGLAHYIKENGSGTPAVAIAYDSRHMSREFARLAADVMSEYGITAYLFDRLMPTPVLSFAVRYLKCSAGIVITASHNPKEYNGYKVYNERGCQITDEAAKNILEKIEESDYFAPVRADESGIRILDDGVLNAFYDTIATYVSSGTEGLSALKIVYTPLNGTGNLPVRHILRRMGIDDITVVPEQELPDGDFPTCPYPNPEERATLDLAVKLAVQKNADLILATDPDADRIGVAVKVIAGDYRLLNGNETGVLLEEYILSKRKREGTLPRTGGVVVKTVVTSDMCRDIAKTFGVKTKEVLTEFKYIGETIDSLARDEEYLFGMEESYGHLVGTHARDKDAVSAAAMIAEMAAHCRTQGKTLWDRLCELFGTYGYYKTALVSLAFPGERGKAEMDEAVATLRKAPPNALCGRCVSATDYLSGVGGLPKSNVLAFAGDDVKVTVRPSGTEPKLKIYYQVKAADDGSASRLLSEHIEQVEKRFARG